MAHVERTSRALFCLQLTLGIAALAACDRPVAPPDANAPVAVQRSAAIASPSNHDVYAQRGLQCATCHPCGARAAGGHAAEWMDTASPQFHAFSANENLASCQGCHGAALDGVGGTVAVSCAQCHGADWKTTCTMCHGGTDSTTGAPPRTVWGRSAETVRVGAHTAHVAGTHGLGVAACATCHVVPADALASGHANGATADVTFSGLAILGTTTAPAWDRASGTCANTYCHGATLAGGTVKAPSWTQADGSARACGACHGAPPPAPHIQSAACGSCHAGYTATTVNLALHMNGVKDVVAMSCTSCHGQAGQTATAADPLRAAPPLDASLATSSVRVGAHQRHLVAGTYSNAIACATCHASVGGYTTGHSDGVRQVGFTGAANANLQQGTWTAGSGAAAGSCSATWCHGAVIGSGGGTAGGTMTAPSWTDTLTGCTACHGAPPPAPHSTSTDCGMCHAGYTATSVNLATHVNGVVDVVALTCTTCHGSSGQTATAASPLYAAPPADTLGGTTGLRVGAHQRHLVAGTYSNPIACATCHASVGSYTTAHSDGTNQVGFTGAANVNLQKGTWTARSGTTPGSCSATWCHGAVISATGGTSGGTLTAPSWSDTISGCTACHGAPPPAPHTQNAACGSCHTGYTSTSVNLALHMNGVKDVAAMTCTSCHGKAGQTATAASPLNAAPPVDTAGASTGAHVGAHQKHLTGGTYSNAISCQSCHASVGTYTTGHADGTTQVGFTGAANANLRKGTWNAGAGTAAGSCSATWCHGAVISRTGGTSGGTATAPSFTGTITACTACHSVTMSSLTNRHTLSAHRSYACSVCHGTGYSSTAVNKATHMDGTRTIVTVSTGTGIRTWNTSTGSCLPSCHSSKTW